MSAFENEATEPAGAADLLPVGTELLRGSYRITRFIAGGGFGKTYLAKDSLDRIVVIKECFPSDFCRREGTNVVPISRSAESDFHALVDLFKSEARNLCSLEHPNIVRVHQAFDDNNTAYMVLDHIDGRDLGAILGDGAPSLTPDDITKIAKRLIDAVATIHAAGILHSDISPDNVLLKKDGEPVLIDFGAARQIAVSTSETLNALSTVKDGFSPQEFYSAGETLNYSSDLYALAATLHFAITGTHPPVAQERVAAVGAGLADPYVSLANRVDGYDPNLLTAIDRALGLFQIDRPQSAKEWRQLSAGFRIPNRSARWRQVSSRRSFKQGQSAISRTLDDPLSSLRSVAVHPPYHTYTTPRAVMAVSASLGVLALGAGALLYANGTETATSALDTGVETSVRRDADFLLSDGTSLDVFQHDGASFLRVTFRPEGSLLKEGDVLVAGLPDGKAVGTPNALRAARDAARDAGQSQLRLAVRRGDAVRLIDIDLNQLFENPEG